MPFIKLSSAYFLPAIFLSSFLVGGCVGNNSPNSAGISAAAGSGGSAFAGDASFSATIDGVAVTGKGIDALQLQNAAYLEDNQKGDGKNVLFILFSTTDGNDTKANYSLRFLFPARTGTVVKSGLTDHACNCGLTLNTNINHGNLAQFWADSITVTISSLTQSRISGTFSGKFVLSSDTPRGDKKQAMITDGKFDIPFSTSKMRPS
jgi:hypothetical protein